MTVTVSASKVLRASADQVFTAVTDLARQERWMVATRLYELTAPAPSPQVGARLAAFTGVAGVGFLDVMTVTEYDPPRRWVTAHEADFVRGVGIFEIDAARDDSCRVTWTEHLDLPFGLVGRLGWPLVRPVARVGLQVSLRRLAVQLRADAAAATTGTTAVTGGGRA
ncbi:SRPBCC family protein [Nakamurella leprariae]|uniref:SRPBCC family protein n=1 Tax=Nakamurella leprariae TaxID=2803911 RepID=A0A939C043_9ACTN|nr:SRPBCC family protein [Nakamurella leprariae]MBM9465792.1 SRPBCC family protein [Nakamurella leprariae]